MNLLNNILCLPGLERPRIKEMETCTEWWFLCPIWVSFRAKIVVYSQFKWKGTDTVQVSLPPFFACTYLLYFTCLAFAALNFWLYKLSLRLYILLCSGIQKFWTLVLMKLFLACSKKRPLNLNVLDWYLPNIYKNDRLTENFSSYVLFWNVK